MLRIMPDLDIPSALAARFKLSPRWIIALLTSRSRKNAPLTSAHLRRTIAAARYGDAIACPQTGAKKRPAVTPGVLLRGPTIDSTKQQPQRPAR